MLNFQNLNKLEKHISYLQNKLSKKNIYIVGGAIRDILLNVDTNPLDIDTTTSGNPQKIYNQINKENISIFKTDKYGTITIIPKKNELDKYFSSITTKGDTKLEYEITPLRKEGDYKDFRHPGEINWSKSIYEDSKRRDFTINCMYYTSIKIDPKVQNDIQPQNINLSSLASKLKDLGIIYLSEQNLLIVQSKEYIESIFPDSKIDKNQISNIIQNKISYKINSSIKSKDQKKDKLNIIIDPFEGIKSLIKKEFKAVGNPDNRFTQDPLRVIRGIRQVNILNQHIDNYNNTNNTGSKNKGEFESLLSKIKEGNPNFDFDRDTRTSMQKHYYLINRLPKERINQELMKSFKKSNPYGMVVLLDKLNLLEYLFPSVYRLKGIDQPVKYHTFDCFNHSLLGLKYIQKINSNPLVKIAMLYHDVGKKDQYHYYNVCDTHKERQKIHGTYLSHPKIGSDLAKQDLQSLGFSNKQIKEIVFYIANHMKPENILSSKPKNIIKKIKKRLSEYGKEKSKNLIDITIADRLGQDNPLQKPDISNLENLKKLIDKIYDKQGEFSKQDMAINGNDIIKHFDIQPGPQIGKLLEKAFQWVLQEPKKRNHKKIIIKYLKNN